MACSKCGKKRKLAIKTLTVPDKFRSFSQEVDENIYFVQATQNVMVNVGSEKIRFLPGQLVKMSGTLLCSLLAVDRDLFRFREPDAKMKFLKVHSSFSGVI